MSFPLNSNDPYIKPTGERSTLGAEVGGGSYTLPTASADTKGGVKIGSGLTMTGEVLSVSGGGGGNIYTHYVHFSRGTSTGDANGTIIIVRNNNTPITKDELWDILYNDGSPLDINCINGTRGTNTASMVYALLAEMSSDTKQWSVKTLSGSTTVAYDLLTISDTILS